jgi:hypothetical protein
MSGSGHNRTHGTAAIGSLFDHLVVTDTAVTARLRRASIRLVWRAGTTRRVLTLHITPLGICSRFADRRLSVFVIEGPHARIRGRDNFFPRPAAARGTMPGGRSGAVG